MEWRTTQQLIDDGTIPPEIAADVMITCSYDGCPIVRTVNLTQARCMHPECRGHMKYRADALLKHLDVKGVGPETCLTYIKMKGLFSHFGVIPIVFGEVKPRIHLWEIAMLSFIPGISTGWEDMLAGYVTFREYFESGNAPLWLRPYKDRLYEAEGYFSVKPPLAKSKWDVMITGSVHGYSNRDTFIDDCNAVVGGLIRIKKSGAKQSADYLICEYKDELIRSLQLGLEGTSKANAAWKGGTKIVTSAEFLEDLHTLVRELLDVNKES